MQPNPFDSDEDDDAIFEQLRSPTNQPLSPNNSNSNNAFQTIDFEEDEDSIIDLDGDDDIITSDNSPLLSNNNNKSNKNNSTSKNNINKPVQPINNNNDFVNQPSTPSSTKQPSTSSSTTTSTTNDGPLDTLDEPVSETLKRDFKRIGVKLWHVLYPKTTSYAVLRDCKSPTRIPSRKTHAHFLCFSCRFSLVSGDLWGPLLLCLMLAIMLSSTSREDQQETVFASVFVIVWVGAAVVTVNGVLLGGNL
eukprot:TRINITY_DN459_c0_g1_i1.p1 TRINITY_DN459_c0_g1~~TRINITY_DN459_c0_g1_i1.p1  ORF type:complete len:256 (+),score=76.55 TRINITY_DN459_c0_g1_i1:23-769(+)